MDYGDRTGSQAGVVTGATCQGPSHTYKTLGTFTINVVVKGSVTGTGSASRLIGVTPPIIAVGPVSVSGSTIEGSSVTAKAGFTPTGVTETYRCTVDYGDGLGTPAGIVSGSTCTGPKHALRQGGSWIVTVSIYGSAGTYGTSSRTITVTNVAPVLTKFTVTPSAKAGATVTMSATFTDPGSTETYQVWVNWGDGSTSTYTLGSLVRATSATHSYAKVGIYTVTVNVSDGEVAADSADVAIYDPARTLTGSGTYASGVGFCQLTAKCNVASTGTLAVSAKYAAGATKPTVCLSLSAKEFTFNATTADWFVAVDGTAVIQGAGTVNGKTGYRYLTTLIDGQPDSLIINIIDSNGNTVYSTGLAPLKTGSITLK